MKKLAILLATSTALFCQCSKAPIENERSVISGQVFVIQQNRVNVKLGGILINYVPKKSLQDRVEWISQNQIELNSIKEYSNKLKSIDKILGDSANEIADPDISRFFDSARNIQKRNWMEFDTNPTVKELYSIDIAYRKPSFSDIDADRSRWLLASLFTTWQATAITEKSTTDADGNFSISIPKNGEGYILAQASRLVSSEHTEYYVWIFEINGKQEGPVHLTSQNVVNTSILATLNATLSNTKTPQRRLSLGSLNWFDHANEMLDSLSRNNRKIEALRKRSSDLNAELKSLKLRL